MGYTIPLKFIRISEKMSVCATRIVCLMNIDSGQARRIYKDERQAKTLLLAEPARKTETLVFMDNGTVIASPFTMGRILSNIASSGSKAPRVKRAPIPAGTVQADELEDILLTGQIDETPDIDGVGKKREDYLGMDPGFPDEDLPEDGDPDLIDEVLGVDWDGDVR